MRRLLIVALLVVGCGGRTGAQAPTVAPYTPTVEVTPDPIVSAPAPTMPRPKSYATLTSRDWAKVVKAPDTYLGKGYKLWACIAQFDAATGTDTFRGNASWHKETYWYKGSNSFFVGVEAQLADFLTGDVVAMNVIGLGSYSYDTQTGGNTTVPLFEVVTIKHAGSC